MAKNEMRCGVHNECSVSCLVSMAQLIILMDMQYITISIKVQHGNFMQAACVMQLKLAPLLSSYIIGSKMSSNGQVMALAFRCLPCPDVNSSCFLLLGNGFVELQGSSLSWVISFYVAWCVFQCQLSLIFYCLVCLPVLTLSYFLLPDILPLSAVSYFLLPDMPSSVSYFPLPGTSFSVRCFFFFYFLLHYTCCQICPIVLLFLHPLSEFATFFRFVLLCCLLNYCHYLYVEVSEANG